MRKLLSTFFLVILVIFSCQKGNSPAGPGGSGGGGTNPPPPPPGGITITGISPLKAYQGDTITLTGSGFDPDKLKDTVVIGAIETLSLTPYFKPGGNQFWYAYNSGTTIISATATQIKFTTDASMEVAASEKQPFALKVSAGAKSMNTNDTLVLKSLPKFIGLDSYDPQQRHCYATFAGDSLTIIGNGFYPPLSIEINGKTIDYLQQQPDNVNATSGKATVTGFIGIDYFGTGTPSMNCDSVKRQMTIKITNGDGKVCEGSADFFPGPNSTVTEVDLGDGTSIFQKSKAGTVPILIKGYALRDLTLEVDGLDLADNSTFTETLGFFGGDLTGTVTTSIDVGGLPTPTSSLGATYNVWIKNADGQRMNGVGFTLFP